MPGQRECWAPGSAPANEDTEKLIILEQGDVEDRKYERKKMVHFTPEIEENLVLSFAGIHFGVTGSWLLSSFWVTVQRCTGSL